MKTTEVECRVLVKHTCGKIGQWVDLPLYNGSYNELRGQAERLLELIDAVDLSQFKAGFNPETKYG